MFKVGILISLISSCLYATPILYTFTGAVTSVNVDDMGIVVGDYAEYRFLVDRDLSGYYTDNGTQIVINDPHYFYVEYLGGSPYYALSTDNVRTHNSGYEERGNVNLIQFEGSITTPNSWSFINVSSRHNLEWVIGSHYTGRNLSFGVNSDYREIFSDLILSDITPFTGSPAVPEPTTIGLFAFGLFALAGYHGLRRRNAKLQN